MRTIVKKTFRDGSVKYENIPLESLKTYQKAGWEIAKEPPVKTSIAQKQIDEVKKVNKEVAHIPAIEQQKIELPKKEVATLPEDFEYLKLKEMKVLDFVKENFTEEEITTWTTKKKATEAINLKK
jgi:hypothetical protein